MSVKQWREVVSVRTAVVKRDDLACAISSWVEQLVRKEIGYPLAHVEHARGITFKIELPEHMVQLLNEALKRKAIACRLPMRKAKTRRRKA